MKKNKLGQFFTRKVFWLYPQIKSFIEEYNNNNILDPFAGEGDLLGLFDDKNTIGFDIDPEMNYIYNDSLKKINYIPDTFIVTNPPYLSKSSSKRKKINHEKFNKKSKDDLYKIALDRMLNSKMPGVAIVPESFINSKYSKKNIYSITILIPNPFKETEVPVCIVCFDSNKIFENTIIFKNDIKLGFLETIKKKSGVLLKKNNQISIKFNDEFGKLALVAYDSTNGKKIRFLKTENLLYEKPQKISSRVISKIKLDKLVTNKMIYKLNLKLDIYRKETSDVLLTPFKGNDNFDNRRRRLDYKTARKIINSI